MYTTSQGSSRGFTFETFEKFRVNNITILTPLPLSVSSCSSKSSNSLFMDFGLCLSHMLVMCVRKECAVYWTDTGHESYREGINRCRHALLTPTVNKGAPCQVYHLNYKSAKLRVILTQIKGRHGKYTI